MIYNRRTHVCEEESGMTWLKLRISVETSHQQQQLHVPKVTCHCHSFWSIAWLFQSIPGSEKLKSVTKYCLTFIQLLSLQNSPRMLYRHKQIPYALGLLHPLDASGVGFVHKNTLTSLEKAQMNAISSCKRRRKLGRQNIEVFSQDTRAKIPTCFNMAMVSFMSANDQDFGFTTHPNNTFSAPHILMSFVKVTCSFAFSSAY